MTDNSCRTVFKRMAGTNKWLLYGGIFVAGGAFFLIGGILALCKGQMDINLLGIVLGCVFLWFGGSCVAYFFQTVSICDGEIRLMLGPLILGRLPAQTVCSVFCASLKLNKGADLRQVIVLSTAERTWLERQTDLSSYLNGKTPFAAHLPIRYGIWLECTPERIKELQKVLPDVEFLS